MRRAVLLVVALASAPAAAEVRVEVVLDSSQEMWAPLTDRRPGLVAARMALESWVLERSADRDLTLGLSLVGGSLPLTEHGGCEDVPEIVPPGPVEPPSWLAALEGVRAIGPRPVLLAVAAAAERLGPGLDPSRIVLVTSGEESCFGDAQAAIEALAAGTELRIVGVGLSDAAAERLGSVAPIRNATSTVALLAALRWSLEELDSATPAEAPVRIRVGGLTEQASAALVHAITGSRRELSLEGDRFVGAAEPGCYALELTSDDGSPTELDRVHVEAGSGLDLELELPAPPLPDLGVTPIEAWSGGPVFVSIGSVGAGTFDLLLTSPGEPMPAWMDLRSASGPEATVELRAPDEPGDHEIRLNQHLEGGLRRLVGRAPISVAEPATSVEAAAEIRPFEALEVTWAGPGNPGDHLSLVPADGTPTNPASCRLVSATNPIELTAPGEEGFWEVRYVSGLTGRTLARSAVEVTAIIVTLDGPEQVAAGRSFEVAWEGPAGTADYVSIAVEGGADDDYVDLSPASRGSPARFIAPRTPGSYEVRYVEGASGRIRRRAALEVVEEAVRLKVPRKILAGTRFDVRWDGPDRPGDILAVAHPGDPAQVHEDWTYTSAGSPASVAAPFEPGRYELRYITDGGREVLAAVPIEVQ
jgi:Ca-activated chloride channel family protein